MLALVQPFGLQNPSGGPRILRALLADAPYPYVSVCTTPAPPHRAEHQVHLPLRPHFGRIESTRFVGPLGINRLDVWLGARFEERLERLFRDRAVRIVHAIPQGLDFWYAFRVARRLGLPYILNVHDDMTYNLQNHSYVDLAMERLAEVWAAADARVVISDAMGEAYTHRYGRPHDAVITDGLPGTVRAAPRPQRSDRLRIYFMGALHLSYHPLFKVLMESLAQLRGVPPATETTEVSLVVRGSALPVETPAVPVEERPFAPEAVVDQDFREVDVLYLPLPFDSAFDAFVRYSLSTKLVTYLGSGLPILYHGPRHAAAARLLAAHDAAILVDTMDPGGLADGLRRAHAERDRLVRNALALGRARFRLDDQRTRFWNLLASHAPMPAHS